MHILHSQARVCFDWLPRTDSVVRGPKWRALPVDRQRRSNNDSLCSSLLLTTYYLLLLTAYYLLLTTYYLLLLTTNYLLLTTYYLLTVRAVRRATHSAAPAGCPALGSKHR